MLFSVFYCAAGKLKRCRNLRGPFTFKLFLYFDGSEVVDCNPGLKWIPGVVFIFFDMTDCCCFCKVVLCWFGLSGLLAWSELIHCFDAEYRWAFLSFLRRGVFLLGMQADKTLDALSS